MINSEYFSKEELVKLTPDPMLMIFLLKAGLDKTSKIFSNTFCDSKDINELEHLIKMREMIFEFMGTEDMAKESVEVVKSYIKDKLFEQKMRREAISIAIEEANKERGLK